MRARFLLIFAVLPMSAACDSNAAPRASAGQAAPIEPAAPQAPVRKPLLVAGQTPVAAFVAEQLLAAPKTPTLLYVGASWCEPCQRFHRALERGELDGALSGTRFIEYDYDQAKAALELDGYTSRLIPLFAVPAADGRSSGHSIEGSIKGAGAVDEIMPRLRALLDSFVP